MFQSNCNSTNVSRNDNLLTLFCETNINPMTKYNNDLPVMSKAS